MSNVKPILKRIHSPDVSHLESYSPTDPSCFGFLLQAMFGPEGSEGEESFDIIVCTPSWLAREVERKGLVHARHHLVVKKYDLPLIHRFLSDFAKSSVSRTWQEAAAKLSRLGKWEFEDYKP